MPTLSLHTVWDSTLFGQSGQVGGGGWAWKSKIYFTRVDYGIEWQQHGMSLSVPVLDTPLCCRYIVELSELKAARLAAQDVARLKEQVDKAQVYVSLSLSLSSLKSPPLPPYPAPIA